MKVLAALPMYGAGTVAAESLHSILHRLARTYCVSFRNLCALLFGVVEASPWRSRSAPISVFTGWSTATMELVDALELLTGGGEFKHHTLLKLSTVLASQGGSLFSRAGRWCPDCLHPELGVDYSLLSHCVSRIGHCPIHGAVLLSACTKCGLPRGSGVHEPRSGVCRSCKSELWTQRGSLSPQSTYDKWVERQLLQLVAYATDSTKSAPRPGWAHDLANALDEMAGGTRLRYSRLEREVFHILRHSPGPERRFSPDVLLRFAAVQCVDLTDVFLDPRVSASPRMEGLQPIRGGRASRHRVPADRWVGARARLDELLAQPETIALPSVASLCRDLGVTESGLIFQFGSIVSIYSRERRRRDVLIYGERKRAALEVAKSRINSARAAGSKVRFFDLVDHVVREMSCTRHLAELVAAQARREEGVSNSQFEATWS